MGLLNMTKRTFIILLMSAFSAMLGLGIISPFLPEFAEAHGANGFWLGMIFAGFGISRGIIMPIVGKMSDRVGRKVFVAGGLFLYTLISLCYPLAEGVLELTIVRILHGFAAGMILPIVMAYIGQYAKKGEEGVTSSMLTSTFFLGFAAGPLLGGLLDQHYGFDAVFHGMAILGGVTFIIVMLFLPDTKSVEGEVKEELSHFASLIKHNIVKAVLIIAVISTVMMAVFISYLPSFAERININPEHVGFIITIGIILAGLLQIPLGKLADKFDSVGKFIQMSVGMTIGMLALLAIPLCPDYRALVVVSAFIGLGAGITAPALAGMSIRIGKKVGMGSWMGIIHAARSLGFVCAPLIFGIILDHMGINEVFYLIALFVLIGMLTAGYFLKLRVVKGEE